MIVNLKKFLQDIYFVSKLTGTKNKKKRIFLSILFLFLAFGSDIVIIIVIASLFQNANFTDIFVIQFFIENIYLLPVVVVLRQVFSYLDVLNTFSLKFDVEENLRVYLLNEVFDKGNFSIGDAYHFMNSFALSVGAFYHSLTSFLASIIQLSLYAGYLIYSDFQTLGILIIGAAVLYLPTKFFTKKGRTYAHLNWEADRDYNAHLQKILENIFLIKLLHKVNEEIETFRKILNRFYKAHLNNQKVGTLTTSFPTFATYFLLSILLAFFNYARVFTLDFIGILVRLFQEFSKLNKNIMLVSNNHVVIKKLYELVDNKTNIYKQNFSILASEEKAISFRDISFKYFNSEVEIFDNLNLNIEKNKHTIITGPNGSGKSTLLGLSAGLLFPQKGKIVSYSNKFGYVGVTPLIISGTLRDNLVYGNSKNIPDKDLIAYLEKFQVFNESAGNNLDNIVNNKILSSGQLQKISFIRSLISDVDILLLDESTSNLDENSRKLIFDLLKKSEMTIINSTHNHQDFDYDNHLKIVIENEKRLVIPG
jgi:ABC-type multidrug transport system fused ATPase/permease subunit